MDFQLQTENYSFQYMQQKSAAADCKRLTPFVKK